MNVGFFTVFRNGDAQHFLHADALVHDVQRVMPGAPVVQLTDERTPVVAGTTAVRRLQDGPLLERRLEHYASCTKDWLLLDTDTTVAKDVRAVFDDGVFDVALIDRTWPHCPQDEATLQTMPYNTGVVFSRSSQFWARTLEIWRGFIPEDRASWYSEQRAVWATVRSGRFRVKILPGLVYNYPPKDRDDAPEFAAIRHYKGQRKAWLTERIYAGFREAVA